MKSIKYYFSVLAAFFALSPSAFAAGPDFTALTAGIDWTTTVTALLAVLLGMMSIAMVWAGGKKIYHMVKGA